MKPRSRHGQSLADFATFEANASEVTQVLRAVANVQRLRILCALMEWRTLTKSVGLSRSALSKHLTKMRDEGILNYRREGLAFWYRLSEPRIELLLVHLQKFYSRH